MKAYSKIMCMAASILMAAACNKPAANTPDEPEKLATPVIEILETTDNSFTAGWNAVENASGYEVIFLEETIETTDTTISFTGLSEGTYTISARAVGDEGFVESEWANAEVTIEKPWVPSEEDWYGDWVLHSDKTLVINSDTDIHLEERSQSVEISIRKHPDYNHQVIIEGLSVQDPELPFETVIDNLRLGFFNMVPAGSPDEHNSFPAWLAFTEIKDGSGKMSFMLGNFNAYLFTLNDRNSATAEAYKGNTDNGKEFEVICFEIFSLTTSLDRVGYYSDFPIECPAGRLYMERK